MIVVLLAAMAVPIAACGSSSDSGSSPSASSAQNNGPATGTPYEVGFTSDLSQQFAAFGTGLKSGFQAYFDYANQHGGVNSHPVHVTFLDDRAKTDTGNANFLQMVTQSHVSAVGGYLVSNICASSAALAKANTTPILCNATSSDLLAPVQPYLYSAVLQQAEEALPMFQFARTLVKSSPGKAAIIYTASAASVSLDKNLKDIIAKAGWTLTSDQSVSLTAADLSAQTAAIVNSHPDVVFSALNDSVATLFYRSMKSQSASIPMVAYDGNTTALPPALRDPTVYVMSGLIFAGNESGAGVEQFRTAVTASGFDPKAPFVNKGYLQAQILAGGLKACGFPCTGAQLQVALDKLKIDTQGFAFGPVAFTPGDHEPYHKMNVYHWDAQTSSIAKAGGPFDGGTSL
jgi:branched-chain amino acid transport system substrate-binding protein